MIVSCVSSSVLLADDSDDGYLVTEMADKFEAHSFQGFLTRLGRNLRKERKMMVIVDNAR